MAGMKHSVAVVVRGPGDGTFLVVKRPEDPADPLAGAWGFPAVTLGDGEDEASGAVRAGRVKLGVELRVTAKLGEKTADRGGYALRLSEYEAALVSGVPSVPQPGSGLTQYTAWRYASDPAVLGEAAARGSLCARIFLESPG